MEIFIIKKSVGVIAFMTRDKRLGMLKK